MDQKEKIKIYEQLSWDYSIPPEDIEAVLKGNKAHAGHFTQEKLFIRMFLFLQSPHLSTQDTLISNTCRVLIKHLYLLML